jgi:hypothetical protein
VVADRTPQVRLVLVRPILNAAAPEPIPLVSACQAMGRADERVHFSANSGSDGIFSRDRSLGDLDRLIHQRNLAVAAFRKASTILSTALRTKHLTLTPMPQGRLTPG